MKDLGLRVMCAAFLAFGLGHGQAEIGHADAGATAKEELSLVDGLLLSKVILRLPDPYAMLTKPESPETNLVEGTYTSRSEMLHRYVDVAKLLQKRSDEEILTIFRTLDTHKDVFIIPDEAFYEWRLNILARLIYEVDVPAPVRSPAQWWVMRWGIAYNDVQRGDFLYPFYFDEDGKLDIRAGQHRYPQHGESLPAWKDLEFIAAHYPRRDLEKLKIAGTPYTDGRDFDEYPLPPYILPETGLGFLEGLEFLILVDSLPDPENLLIDRSDCDTGWVSDDGASRGDKITAYVEVAKKMQALTDAQIHIIYRIHQEARRSELSFQAVLRRGNEWRLNLLSRLIYDVPNSAPPGSPRLWEFTAASGDLPEGEGIDYLFPFKIDSDNVLQLHFGLRESMAAVTPQARYELEHFQKHFPRRNLTDIMASDSIPYTELIEEIRNLPALPELVGECLEPGGRGSAKLLAYVDVANRMAAMSFGDIMAVCDVVGNPSGSMFENPQKLRIIVRLIYQVPDTYPVVQDPRFWTESPIVDGKINYLNPLAFDQHSKMCFMPLTESPETYYYYWALAAEVTFFAQTFPKRDLSVYLEKGD